LPEVNLPWEWGTNECQEQQFVTESRRRSRQSVFGQPSDDRHLRTKSNLPYLSKGSEKEYLVMDSYCFSFLELSFVFSM
jgi:hypothetical protein